MRATAGDSAPSMWRATLRVAWSASGRPSLPFQPAARNTCVRFSYELADVAHGPSNGGLVICGIRVCLRDALPPIAADVQEAMTAPRRRAPRSESPSRAI
jgi:hypothetical protein